MFSSLLKTTLSITRPITIITSIIAITCETSFRERPALSRNPNPRKENNSSAPITPLHANAQPYLKPEIMYGNAAGINTAVIS